MSEMDHNRSSRAHTDGDAFAGVGNGPLNASSLAITPSSGPDGLHQSEHTENLARDTNKQDQGGTTGMNAGESSTTSGPSHQDAAGQQYAESTSVGTRESQGTPGRHSRMADMGVQPLLPEDDGMGALRKRIHAIRDLGYTSTEQARMIHDLMTENYHSSRESSASHLSPVSSPTPSSRTPERAYTPNRWSGQSFDQPSISSASTATSMQHDITHNLTAEDLEPTYHPRSETEPLLDDGEDADVEELEEPCLGCPHYKRNVKLQCFDCKKWYTCRFCHDAVEDHHLDRPKTENMLCMFCGHAQPAGQYCKSCDELAAQYFCAACKLWDNDASKSIYHCNDCGICRIGKGIGKDFFHCKTCSVCLPISIENTHKCIERSTQCDCPICGDYMFTSPETVVFMRCGHSIHQRCLSEYSKTSYRCPICSKTITNMEARFRNLDRTIESQPMPADFKDTKAIITCNDCGTKSVVKYHWLGLKCDMCESYNTTQLSVLNGEALGLPEQSVEDGNSPASRPRASSHGADESGLPSLANLQIDPSSAPGEGRHPQFDPSLPASSSRQFASYNLTRGRAVSPVISNYFGIPSDRHSQRSMSTSFLGLRFNQADENDEGELSIWGTRFRYSYGFLSRGTDPADETPAAEDEEEEELSSSSDSDGRNEDEEDEDEDDAESIDIFGHR
ncbi:hypothetical protein BJX61DRAFT_58364 [Aspergillus egyptiacus]|nr:hypothetical protein BJX61DRAFT_58364 [Aspergillus egyptiacus]